MPVQTSEQMKRNVAYKLRIGDVLRGKPILDGERLKALELGDKNVVRVNIVANVVDKFDNDSGEKPYATLTIDDASGQIRLKMFGDDVEKFSSVNPGNTVMVIGVVRFFNNEVYISPEIISVKEPRYLLVRKLELGKELPKEVKKEEIVAVKDQIIDMIKKSEENGGVETEKIIMEIKAAPELINQEIQRMLEDGIIYEPRPGMVRYLG